MTFILPQRRPSLDRMVFAASDETSSPLTAQWLGQDHEVVGPRFTLEQPPPLFLETTDGFGNLGFVTIEPPLAVDLEIPEAARTLILREGDGEVARLAREELARAIEPGMPERRCYPDDATPPAVTVVSERFPESGREAFFDAVEGLRAYWCRNFRPFSDPRFGARLAIEALFWPADEKVGNFATPDSRIFDRVLTGDQPTLQRYLRTAGIDPGRKPVVLVLIASQVRAGAGGSAGRFADFWAPSWVTNRAGVSEDWEAVALHEVGHAYGLMDEYTTPYAFPPRQWEPNVSPSPLPDNLPLPWKRMLTHQPDPHFTPHLPSDGVVVSACRGARYSADYYRPSETCLMRVIGNEARPVRFCPVCVEVIADQL